MNNSAHIIKHQELLELLKQANILSLPGLGDDPGLATEAIEVTAEAKSELLEMLHYAAQPEHLIMAARQSAGGDLLAAFSMSHTGVTAHIRPEPGLHQFQTFPEAQSIADWVYELLCGQGYSDVQTSDSWITLSNEALHSAQEAARLAGYEEAQQVLVEAEVEEDLARSLAIALATPFSQTVLVSIKQPLDDDQRLVQNEITFWEGTNGFWVFNQADHGQVFVENLTTQDIRNVLADCVHNVGVIK